MAVDARWVRALASSPSDDAVLAGTEDGQLLVLSLEQQKEIKRVEAHAAAIFSIAFSSDRKMLATAGGDGTIGLHSWPELQPIGKLKHGTDAIWSVAFVQSDSQLVSGGASRRLQLWDLEKMESVCTIARSSDWITDLVLLPNSTVVAAACMDGKLLVADYAMKTPVTQMAAAESAIWAAQLSPQQDRIALGNTKAWNSVCHAKRMD